MIVLSVPIGEFGVTWPLSHISPTRQVIAELQGQCLIGEPMPRSLRVALVLVACVVAWTALPSQPAPVTTAKERALGAQSSTALARARELVAAGDSAQAIALLKDAAARDPDNGPLWYEYGRLLSARTKFAWRRGIMPAGIPALVIAAETSLARASRLSPDSIQYALDYGRHLWGTNSTSITRATNVQKHVVQDAAADDPRVAANASDNVGVMLWRRFEVLLGRGNPTWTSYPPMPGTNGMIVARSKLPTLMRDWVRENFAQPREMYGIGLYKEAEEYFRYARIADPDNEMYFRHEMMLMAERERWQEMGAISGERVRLRPLQPWPWLVLGISEHRQGRTSAAQVAFDSGFARLPVEDRQRLESLIHILPQKRREWYQNITSDAKAQLDELYWNTANPSMLLPSNPMHAEFRARAVYAELRFTDDEQVKQGASSAKGIIYIRYGPPDVVWAMGDGAVILNQWYYYDEMLLFVFQQFRLYGTAALQGVIYDDRIDLENDRPATFKNLPILRNRVDSVSTQVVRFRAPGDSVDLAVFAGIRTGAVRRGSPIDTSSIQHGLFVLDQRGRALTRVTGKISSAERDTTVMYPQNYFVRTTNAAQAVRLEALEQELMQVARSISDISGFTTRGFGVSDLLLAASITAPVASSSARWTDYRITPLTGNIVKRGAPVALIWESYDAAGDSAVGRLRVNVRVQRETSTGLVALTGRVVGGIREALGSRSRDRGVTISYDREFSATPALVDHLLVDVGTLDPGMYRITLQVTNLTNNQVIERSQRFRIVR
jgi:GWxTD domain-containing protein